MIIKSENKKNSILKKMFVIALAITISFDCYAEVSENDENAFITKSEFENLKSKFITQLTEMNVNLDGKIDEAIAAYIAGVTIASKESADLPLASFKEVTCFNGSINPEFSLPDFDGNIMFGLTYKYDHSSTGWNCKIMSGAVRQSYQKTWGASETQRRPLVTGNKQSTNVNVQKDGMVWNGIALRYVENYSVSRSLRKTQNDMAFLDRPDKYVFATKFVNSCALCMTDYLENYETDTTAVLSPNVNYGYKLISASAGTDYTWQNKSFSTSDEIPVKTNTSQVTLEPVNGKIKEYEHIIEWNGNSTWCVSNETWLKTFRKNNSNTKKSTELASRVTTIKNMDCLGLYMDANATHKADGDYRFEPPVGFCWLYKNAEVTLEDTVNSIIPSIGMLKNDQKASDIKQHNLNMSVRYNNKSWVIENPKLHEGFQLLPATKGTKIEWSPFFKECKYDNGSGTLLNTNKINVMVSFGKFNNTNDTDKVIQVMQDGSKVLKDYATTSANTCKMEWEMPDDGWVYIKWWPDISSTYINNFWEATLDVDKSKMYIYELSEDDR